MPAEIADVRLHDDARRPVTYTTDRNWGWTLSSGMVLLVLCLTMPVFLIRTADVTSGKHIPDETPRGRQRRRPA